MRQIRSDMSSSVVKERLIVVFGECGTDLLLKHIEDLDSIFGREAATIIRFVMGGGTRSPK